MTKSKPELLLERMLFSARWLMAPFYLGMVLALAAVLYVFMHELISEIIRLPSMDAEQVILLALSLIDLSLAGNLLLIVILSGYENFVSKIDVVDHEDRPSWMGTVDFSGLKMKLIASIVAISAIALLRAFLPLGDLQEKMDDGRLKWMVIIHLTFVASGVFLAVMDWVASKTDDHHAPEAAAQTTASGG
ncbi:TIGR00645 family protein [Rhizobiales bacterium GAS191]|nr:TIGR00645 family protein [Rhizobiales bacterium GAS113]SEE21701.1 TIGR00645 family protein [Rhizobiales bacterium GAS191]SEE34479.1 TIGR00645 family protein [Rhizobiales bacterium GAS188]